MAATGSETLELDISWDEDEDFQLAGALSERRTSTRLPVGELALYVDGERYLGRGDLSVGGAHWKGFGTLSMPGRVDVGVRVPGLDNEVRVEGLVLSVRAPGEAYTAVHLRFEQLPAYVQEAIERCVEDWTDLADMSGLV